MDEHRRLHTAALLQSSQDESKKGVAASSSPQGSDKSAPEDTIHLPLHQTSPSLRGEAQEDEREIEQDEIIEDPSSKIGAFKKVGLNRFCTAYHLKVR